MFRLSRTVVRSELSTYEPVSRCRMRRFLARLPQRLSDNIADGQYFCLGSEQKKTPPHSRHRRAVAPDAASAKCQYIMAVSDDVSNPVTNEAFDLRSGAG